MRQLRWTLSLTVLLLFPTAVVAQSDTSLDQLSREFRTLQSNTESSDLPMQTQSVDTSSQTEAAAPTQSVDTSSQTGTAAPTQSFVPSQGSATVPDVVGNTRGSVDDIIDIDAGGYIDPITGRVNSSIEGVKGRVTDGINRALSRAVSPIDEAIQGALGSVEAQVDKSIQKVMAPVDQAIDNVMSGIEGQIDKWLTDLFGEAVEDIAGDVLGEATGGLLGGLLGGGSRSVEKAYDPLSPASSVVTAATFNELLAGVTRPYADIIPFESGGMGLPDYSSIPSVVDALVAGKDGNPNRVIQGADRFSTNPQGLALSLRGEIRRAGSQAVAAGTLSKTGQDLMQAELEGAKESLNAAIEYADDSQDKDVTQDIMKNLSAQLAQDSVIRANEFRQSTIDRQQQAADAMVQTEIAQLLSEQNRNNRASLLGNVSAMQIATAGLFLPGECGDNPLPHCQKAMEDSPSD
ncbi:hypothetical protein [cf. Phormidesmis sp. LEGE 11477]|uniref:hypothetical protein n=1 Tax=cf. Phormidesmis sp. LEGE 11477 TaxID=1828680 RepID=UPI0018802024|nr:hypothetical protein [cf. Phormidesmis sp. LEGE 11477]MBE9062245.1 hypothetical protein [cf. Phormidesmis sp. LEGE 11477]